MDYENCSQLFLTLCLQNVFARSLLLLSLSLLESSSLQVLSEIRARLDSKTGKWEVVVSPMVSLGCLPSSPLPFRHMVEQVRLLCSFCNIINLSTHSSSIRNCRHHCRRSSQPPQIRPPRHQRHILAYRHLLHWSHLHHWPLGPLNRTRP